MVQRTATVMVMALLLLSLSSCAAHVNHPGTANTFDSDTYDALLVTNNVINSTKTAYANGSFTSTQQAAVKIALNDLITVYDAAEGLYCGTPVPGTTNCQPTSYHALVMAGTVTPAQTAAMQTAISSVTTKTSALAAAKGAK